MASYKICHCQLMYHAHENIQLAMAFSEISRNTEYDEDAMESDYFYAEHMAHAMFYLTHARNLRIKEKTNYGYQF